MMNNGVDALSKSLSLTLWLKVLDDHRLTVGEIATKAVIDIEIFNYMHT